MTAADRHTVDLFHPMHCDNFLVATNFYCLYTEFSFEKYNLSFFLHLDKYIIFIMVFPSINWVAFILITSDGCISSFKYCVDCLRRFHQRCCVICYLLELEVDWNDFIRLHLQACSFEWWMASKGDYWISFLA